jgi:hypothetical protein
MCHANKSISTAAYCSNRGNRDFYFPETVELHRCHLSHCLWHSRVAPNLSEEFWDISAPKDQWYSLLSVVSDSKIADFAEALVKHFAKASMKHFPFTEVDQPGDGYRRFT